MFNLYDILVDKEATSYVRIEDVPNKNGMNFGYRARVLAIDTNTGYPSHLTCACINLDSTNGYSVDLNCKFQPWVDTIKEESEIEKVKEIINNIKKITWTVPTYEDSDYEYESEEENEIEEEVNEKDKEEIENNLHIKTLRRKILDDSEDDDATLVPNSPQSSIIGLNTNEVTNNSEISTQ